MFDCSRLLCEAVLATSSSVKFVVLKERRRSKPCRLATRSSRTFHASSIVKMIQRFTGDPINVPIRFFDNLNFAIFQEVVEAPGGGIARRITGIDEVIGYNKHSDGVLTRGMFDGTPSKTSTTSVVCSNPTCWKTKIAAMAGFANKREIYDEMLAVQTPFNAWPTAT